MELSSQVKLNTIFDSSLIEEHEESSTNPLLQRSFEPGSSDVILGRGKKCFHHEGNENFRKTVASRLIEYKRAGKNRTEKTHILFSVVSSIRRANPIGRFIKKNPDTKRWYDVGDFVAKEKISQSFRDMIQKEQKKGTGSSLKRNSSSQPTGNGNSSGSNKRQRLDYTLSEREFDNQCALFHPNSSLFLYDNPFEPTPIREKLKHSEYNLRHQMAYQKLSNIEKVSQNSDSDSDNDNHEMFDDISILSFMDDDLALEFKSASSELEEFDKSGFFQKRKTKYSFVIEPTTNIHAAMMA